MAVPSDFSPTGWWKADSESFAEGAEANPIHDRSGSGRDLSQGTAASRPKFRTAVVNGLPAFRFDGVDDQTSSTAALSTLITAAAGTIYAFCRAKTIGGTGTSSSAQFNHVVRSAVNVQFGVGFRDNAALKYAGAANFDGTGDETPEKLASLDRWYLLLWMHGSGLVYLGVDDLSSTALLSTASGDTSDLGNGIQLSGNNQNFDGDVAEVCTFNTAHDEATRAALQQYFDVKYRQSALSEAARNKGSRILRLVRQPIPLIHARCGAAGLWLPKAA